MYISSITLEDFRCYGGDKPHTLKFGPGLNFFVGNNNAGKTTVFKAVDFVLNARNDEGCVPAGHENRGTRITLTVSGINSQRMAENSNLSKAKDYVDASGNLTLRKSSKGETVFKGKQEVESDVTKLQLQFLNPVTGKFDLLSAPKFAQSLFEPIIMYSDLDNSDYQDFSKTKALGNLFNRVVIDRLKSTSEWQDYLDAHKKVFGQDSIGELTAGITTEVNEYLNSQYGSGSIDFLFEPLDADAFIKNGSLMAEDHGSKTAVSEKGTGMQRAITLALIRTVAHEDLKNDEDRSLIYFLDEPETFMHPMAQDHLLDDLDEISQTSQVFVTTHSPYLLKHYDPEKHRLLAFSRDDTGAVTISDAEGGKLGEFAGKLGPSWGAISYFVFGVPSIDFHIELFNDLAEYRGIQKRMGHPAGPSCMDDWLMQGETKKLTPGFTVPLADSNHCNVNPHGNHIDKTMPVYIRNYIDHGGDDPSLPEGKSRDRPNDKEIEQSIVYMLALLHAVNYKSAKLQAK